MSLLLSNLMEQISPSNTEAVSANTQDLCQYGKAGKAAHFEFKISVF